MQTDHEMTQARNQIPTQRSPNMCVSSTQTKSISIESVGVQIDCDELTQNRDHMLASNEMVLQSSNKFCHFFTQTDYDYKQSDLVQEFSSKEGVCTGTRETADNIELDSTVIGKES